MEELLITNSWKKNKSTAKRVPVAYICVSKFIWWLSRNWLTQSYLKSVHGGRTCAKYGYILIIYEIYG